MMEFKKKSAFALVLALTFVFVGTIIAFATSTPASQGQPDLSATSSFDATQDSNISLNTAWTEGIPFVDLAPGKEAVRSEKVIISPNEEFQYSITYDRPSLVLAFGLRSSDGTEYCQTITGGDDHGVIENVPAGTYELFVRNVGDYSELPAYKDGSLSYSATGCINFSLEGKAAKEIEIDDLLKADTGNKLELLH